MSDHERIALLAAWCESDSHLIVSASPLSPSSERVCDILASSGWKPSKPVPQDLRRRIEAAVRDQESGVRTRDRRGPDLTAAERSQRSVDLLLREYYKMVQSQRETQQKSEGSSSGLQQLFLLLCPVLPSCLDLQHVLAAVLFTLRTAASLTVVLSCLLVPLWLAVIRELLHGHGHRSAGMLAAGGLTWMVLAEGIHRTTHAARQKAARSAVTAANARQSHTNSGNRSNSELLALRQASKTATTSNNNKHTLAQQQLQQLQLQQQAAGPSAAATAASPAGVHRSGPSYLELLPALAALQSALGLPGTAGSVNSRERLADELGRVCTVMGVPARPEMTESPAAMAATIAQLKNSIGI